MEVSIMKKRMISLLLCLCMVFSLLPTAVLAADGEDPDTSAGPGAVPELGNPATEGTSGGIDWKVENGTLTITPSSNPESDDYTEGEMVGDYGTLTKKDPDDADYIAALTAAGYTQSDKGYFHYPDTET